MSIKRIATYGRRGALVRVDELRTDGVLKYRVQWGSKADRQQRAFSGTPSGKREAVAFAEAFTAEMQKAVPTGAQPAPIATRALWEQYKLSAWPGLRPRSKVLYADQWAKWEAFWGRSRPADEFRLTDAHRFRQRLDEAGLSTASIHAIITMVRMVYRFGEAHELIGKNRWHLYVLKVAKERRTQPRAEYSRVELARIWREIDPTDAGQWRAYCVTGLLGLYGMRQNALLHLRWEDVTATEFVLRPEWDKLGERHVHLITPEAQAVFAIARAWREKREPVTPGVVSPWVFPAARKDSTREVYSIQSYWWALLRAEERAEVAHIKWRGGHGFRRGLVGDLIDQGADVEMALKAIGDKDVRMARHYHVRRNSRLDALILARSATVTAPEGTTAGAMEGVTKGQQRPKTTTAQHPNRDTAPSLTDYNTRGYSDE